MSDLISRSELIEEMKKAEIEYENAMMYPSWWSAFNIIREQPTAYSVDNVISQLGDYGNEEIDYYRNTPYENCIRECVSKAIEIVKQGGDANDNCKWSQISTARYETSCGYKLVEFFDTNACYCKQCGKKIKIVGD